MKRSVALFAALLLLLPAPARAQEAPRTDPEVGSASEAVYGIPLEEARRDAAPGVMPGPALRTENGVGSSSAIPGQRPDCRARKGRSARSLEVERRRKRRCEREAAQVAATLAGEPSPVAAGLLVAMVLGVATGGGLLAGRLVGRRARL